MKKYIENLSYIIIIVFMLSCSDRNNIKHISSKEMNTIDMQNLDNKGIFFGHQSVGVNILNGVEKVLKNNKIDFQLSKDSISPQKNRLAILHSAIGKNGEPFTKIYDYKSYIIEKNGRNIDIAIFKFCYTDINSSTDIQEVFNAYTSTIDSLKDLFPEITFIHTTVPLKALQKGPKAFVKRLLGKSIGCEDNIARNKYSNLILEKYGSEYVFDIARFESTKPDGSQEEKIINGKKCYALFDEYTYDGGHLTSFGEDYLGEQFILFLSSIRLK